MNSTSIQMSLRTDRALVRGSARSTRFLLVSLAAPFVESNTERLPLNVGIVLDRSGSMIGDDKFGLARQAVEQSLAMLQPQDQFSLVVFDTEVTTVMPLTPATSHARRDALRRLHDVSPRGGTDLHGGWMAGGAELLRALAGSTQASGKGSPSRRAVNRVLLLTDGQANHGITEPLALQSAATALRTQGVSTSTFGVGIDFDERLLRDIAHEGGGQFYFIEGATQIADLLTSELGEALEVVRQDAELRISMPDGVQAELLNRYRNSAGRSSRELQVSLGDLTSGQELQLVVRLTFPEDREGTVATVGVEFGQHSGGGSRPGKEGFFPESRQEMIWQYASHNANDICPRDVVVDREVAALYSARTRAQATEANRLGDFRLARRLLEKTARKIREYANDDAILTALWRELLAEMEMFTMRTMNASEQKLAFFSADTRARNRDVKGKVRRQ